MCSEKKYTLIDALPHYRDSAIAYRVANYLLVNRAVQLSPAKPFTWTSGRYAPIYCNNRALLTIVTVRNAISRYLTMLSEHVAYRHATDGKHVVAGVATAGIPWATYVAGTTYPLIYVRSEPKKHGLGNQIEGTIKAGDKVIVVEDLISTGKSTQAVVEALQRAGAEVVAVIAIFTYGFAEAFDTITVPVYVLCDYPTLIREAEEQFSDDFTSDDFEVLRAWVLDPVQWDNDRRPKSSPIIGEGAE